MNKVQIVKKKCCGKVFAACCEPECYTDPDWTKWLKVYVREGHEVDMAESGNHFVFETCTCVKPEQPKQLNLFAV